MLEKNVLIVEDSPEIARLLEVAVRKSGYFPVIAQNGKVAQTILNDLYFPVIITDLEMPEMNGFELIDWIRNQSFDSQLIVITSNSELATVVDIVKKGVMDYLVKPVNTDDLTLKLNHAFELSRLRNIEKNWEDERRVRLQRQMEWTLWKQNAQVRAADIGNQNLFYNLRTNFSQGAGFGVLLSLLAIATESAQKTDAGYLIDGDIMDMMIENTSYATRTLQEIQEIDNLISKEPDLSYVKVADVHKMIGDLIFECTAKIKIKNQQVILSELQSDFNQVYVQLCPDLFYEAIKELLINALKFSPPESSILVIIKKDQTNLFVSVMNKPTLSDDIEGITPEIESLVFEPFFRGIRTVDERYESLDNGLGLTRVQKVINGHMGQINLYNINDYLDQGIRVNAEIQLPLNTGTVNAIPLKVKALH